MGWSSVHRQTPTVPWPAESPAGRHHPPIFSSWVESLQCSFPCHPQALCPSLPPPPSPRERDLKCLRLPPARVRTTVHVDYLAGDLTCPCQVQNSVDDVFYPCHRLKCLPCRKRFLGNTFVQWCVDDPGGDGV